MCYNVSLIYQLSRLHSEYDFWKKVKPQKDVLEDLPLFNVTAYHKFPIVAQWNGELQAFKAFWCLIPHVSKTGKPEYTAFNARVETIDKSRMFAPYFKSSRCLVPVSAFYEYNPEKLVTITVNGKTKQVKQPSLIRMKDKRPFMMAGIFSVWVNKKTGEEIPSFSVITTEPNKVVGAIHNRMPAILDEKYFDLWIDRSYKDTDACKKIAEQSYPASKMEAYEVDAEYLYDRNHNDEKCWTPLREKNKENKS